MDAKNKKFLRSLLQKSRVGSSRVELRELAEDLVSETQFINLLPKFESNFDFNSRDIIFELIPMWISFKGKEATLNNFEKILRDHDLNDEAGECTKSV